MNILITGASGFVGSYLCKVLQKEGYKVFPVVRSESSRLDVVPIANQRIVVNMDDKADWSEALTGIDVVVNLAARVHVMHDNSVDPLADFRQVNVAGTMHLAQQAASLGVKHFIQISSIKVNGEQTFGKPFTSMSSPDPQDPYGISKYEAEQALFSLADTVPMEVTVIRPPLVYGRNVKGNLEVLIKAIRKGLPLPFGLVKNRRNMVSLYNLCDLVRECIANNKSYGHIFLAGDGQTISTAELIDFLAKSIGKRALMLPVPVFLLMTVLSLLGKKDMADRLLGDLEVDISFTQQQLDWKPPFTVKESFRMMFQDRG